MSGHLWYEEELGKSICVGHPLPDGYLRYAQSEVYLRRECASKKHYQIVGRPGAYGARWRYGPFGFEKYVTDEEPKISRGLGPRKVIWQRILKDDGVPSWSRSATLTVPRLSGFAELKTGEEDFRAAWSKHARRHLRTFQEIDGWRIEPVTYSEFVASYDRIDKPYFIRRLFKNILKEKIQAHGPLVRLFGVRPDRAGAPLEAGLGVLDLPEVSQSVHLVSFIHAKAKGDYVGYGLIDRWFLEEQKKGIRFLDFDAFWAPGDPAMWRGFSAFKAQFGIRFILHPLALTRSLFTFT
jgi:hypothetical protein